MKKKIAIFTAGVLVIMTILCGFKIGYSVGSEWLGTWYGWYEVTAATGEYVELDGQRNDCIAYINIEELYSNDGTIQLFDESHYLDPLFTLNVRFKSIEEAELLEGGELDSEEFTEAELTFKVKNEIELEDAMWIEGTMANSRGSIIIRMFTMREDCIEETNSFARLKDGTGNLGMTAEELQPEFYDNRFKLAIENGSYSWDVLESVKIYFEAFSTYPENAITLGWAKDEDFTRPVSFCRSDLSDEFSQFVLKSNYGISNLRIVRLNDAGEEIFYQRDFYMGNDLLIVLQLSFNGTEPEYGIRFCDTAGREYFYTISADQAAESFEFVRVEVY